MNLGINALNLHKAYSPKFYGANNINSQNPAKPKTVDADIFYINDIHGRIGNMARIYTAKQMYDASNQKNDNVDKFVLSAGDISAGADLNIVKVANTYMNGMGVEATSDGNHEY
ncbi:hypothetical protein II810_04785, partial [bacterium]|nr:hypothetical protein [bacterium]